MGCNERIKLGQKFQCFQVVPIVDRSKEFIMTLKGKPTLCQDTTNTWTGTQGRGTGTRDGGAGTCDRYAGTRDGDAGWGRDFIVTQNTDISVATFFTFYFTLTAPPLISLARR